MVLQRKFIYMILGGLLALGLVFVGARAFAQTDDESPTETPNEESADGTPVLPDRGWFHEDDFEFRGNGSRIDFDEAQALADALGISLVDLEAAQQTAREAMIAQAVTDGLLTQEQADAILAGDGRLGRGFKLEIENGMQYLADALGISVADLEAAVDSVEAAKLAAMVEAGVITQEQADMMAAQRAVDSYIDREALQATIQSAYTDAVNQALADGAINQAQADALLANAANFGLHGFGFDRGGFGGRGHGGHHGHHGGPDFDNDSQPDTTGTDQGA